jgi:hypothetical protein
VNHSVEIILGTGEISAARGRNSTTSAEDGLRKLIKENAWFMRGEARFLTNCKETLVDLAREQKPSTTILGCSNSRVPPELIFDVDFGELFVVRVARHVISLEVIRKSAVCCCASSHESVCRSRPRRVRRRARRVGIQGVWCDTAFPNSDFGTRHPTRLARSRSGTAGTPRRGCAGRFSSVQIHPSNTMP